MKKFKRASCLLGAAALLSVGFASATPQVTVNFKNNTPQDAVYVPGSSRNESTTYANASPKPAAVRAGMGESYIVRATGSSPITYAMVTYKSGTRSCRFTTRYLMNVSLGGVRTPKWNKSAVSSGGAKCDITITSVNYSTHDWNVDLIMR